jgi:enoyl-CoA hydratase/carnithine racemase
MFSSGMDLAALAGLAEAPEHLRAFRGRCLEAWNLAEEMTKPTVCEIHGVCIGGALELALACDLRVVAADAVIGMPETRIGLIPDVGGSSRRPAVVGLGCAKELVMTGKLIAGEEAERIGLASPVAPAEELETAVEALVDELLACAPVAVGLAKRVMDASPPGARGDARARGDDPGALRGDRGLRRGPARVRRPLVLPCGRRTTTGQHSGRSHETPERRPRGRGRRSSAPRGCPP